VPVGHHSLLALSDVTRNVGSVEFFHAWMCQGEAFRMALQFSGFPYILSVDAEVLETSRFDGVDWVVVCLFKTSATLCSVWLAA
jgi:hypothetical protein